MQPSKTRTHALAEQGELFALGAGQGLLQPLVELGNGEDSGRSTVRLLDHVQCLTDCLKSPSQADGEVDKAYDQMDGDGNNDAKHTWQKERIGAHSSYAANGEWNSHADEEESPEHSEAIESQLEPEIAFHCVGDVLEGEDSHANLLPHMQAYMGLAQTYETLDAHQEAEQDRRAAQ